MGPWRVTSRAVTAEELRAEQAYAGLRVCWGEGEDDYAGEAGRITFVNPPVMPTESDGRAIPAVYPMTPIAGALTLALIDRGKF